MLKNFKDFRTHAAVLLAALVLVVFSLPAAPAAAQNIPTALLTASTQSALLIEREIERRNLERTVLPIPQRYRAIDTQTLESLAIEEPAHVYRLLPEPRLRPMPGTSLNLYRSEPWISDPFRVDLRIAGRISLDVHTDFFDTALVIRPNNLHPSIGIGRALGDNTSFFTFFDPISHEVLALLTHRLGPQTEVGLLAYRNLQSERTDFIANIKFRF